MEVNEVSVYYNRICRYKYVISPNTIAPCLRCGKLTTAWRWDTLNLNSEDNIQPVVYLKAQLAADFKLKLGYRKLEYCKHMLHPLEKCSFQDFAKL